jgi:NitT/TauT family transport system permease protein
MIQMLRPISPIAWIPLAILWFGVGNTSPIFLIFLSSFFPMVVGTIAGVHAVERQYIRAAENFGITEMKLLREIVVPGAMSQIVTGMRIGLGVAWLVVVAAEMVAIDSGLGFLIIDSRNAGNRYDLVVAAMVIIGVIGFGLDVLMRRLERLDSVRWRHAD